MPQKHTYKSDNHERDIYFVADINGELRLVKYEVSEDGVEFELVRGGKSAVTLGEGSMSGLPHSLAEYADQFELFLNNPDSEDAEELEDGSEEESDERLEEGSEEESEEESEKQSEERPEEESDDESDEESEDESIEASDEVNDDPANDEIDDESEGSFVPMIYETTTHGHAGVKQYTYSDEDGDGLYVRVESEWLSHPSQNRSETASSKLGYVGSDDDDELGLAPGLSIAGGRGADRFFYTDELGHSRIEDFSAEDGDLIVFDTGYGLKRSEDVARLVVSLDYEEETQTLEVSFGEYGSIEIIGIASDQISWNLVEVFS